MDGYIMRTNYLDVLELLKNVNNISFKFESQIFTFHVEQEATQNFTMIPKLRDYFSTIVETIS